MKITITGNAFRATTSNKGALNIGEQRDGRILVTTAGEGTFLIEHHEIPELIAAFRDIHTTIAKKRDNLPAVIKEPRGAAAKRSQPALPFADKKKGAQKKLGVKKTT